MIEIKTAYTAGMHHVVAITMDDKVIVFGPSASMQYDHDTTLAALKVAHEVDAYVKLEISRLALKVKHLAEHGTDMWLDDREVTSRSRFKVHGRKGMPKKRTIAIRGARALKQQINIDID
jgi:hypothetical protein